jgi:hypothetical protein
MLTQIIGRVAKSCSRVENMMEEVNVVGGWYRQIYVAGIGNA